MKSLRDKIDGYKHPPKNLRSFFSPCLEEGWWHSKLGEVARHGFHLPVVASTTLLRVKSLRLCSRTSLGHSGTLASSTLLHVERLHLYSRTPHGRNNTHPHASPPLLASLYRCDDSFMGTLQ